MIADHLLAKIVRKHAFPDDDGVFVLSYCLSISNGHDIIQDK